MTSRRVAPLNIVLVVVVGGLAVLLFRQQRTVDQLEQRVANVSKPTGESAAAIPAIVDRPRAAPGGPGPVAPTPQPARDEAARDQPALASPRSPEARRLVEELHINETSWTMMMELNRHWREVVDRAQRGEPGTDPVELTAEMRERKLRRLLGEDGYKRYLDFEREAPGARAAVVGDGGVRYEAVEYD